MGSGGPCLPDFLTKELLKRLGFPYHTAPGEAEAECALFQKEGIVDAVLSEDVDTMMFGSTLSLRNWSVEGVRGNKSPSHVNVYKAEATKESAGLDSEGMILVALMSGGDYIPAGVPGCGPKTACEAAKAGFGRELCRIPKGDDARLTDWRERLGHELRTNERRLFRQRHKALKIPESFPDMTVLGYYMRPAVSSKERLVKLRDEINWNSGVNVPELRLFVADAFNWSFLVGAKKFIRGLAPALLVHQLVTRSTSPERDEETLEAKESAEALLIKAVCDRRSHWNTDGMSELRIAYVPNEIVCLDLDAEEEEDFQSSNVSGDEQLVFGGENDSGDRSPSPTKQRGPSVYDPTQIEKIWILETFAKLGVPALVETWEEDMRDPMKFASRKARVRKALSKSKAGAEYGALDGYVKVKKPNATRLPLKDISTDRPMIPKQSQTSPSSEAADALPSPERPASSKHRRPLEQKSQPKDDKTVTQRKIRTKSRPTVQSSPSSSKDPTANPWTLSKRPPDTLNFKSPTRYSALGIYAPGDPESLDKPPNTLPLAQDKHSYPISPPASPSSRKRHSRPITPISDTESEPNTPQTHQNRTKTNPPSNPFNSPSTPKPQTHTDKPSPRQKRSPPIAAFSALQLSDPQQLRRTPTSSTPRKETLLDKFLINEKEPLTADKKVNRKLDFSPFKSQSYVSAVSSSPTSDVSTLPSPSGLVPLRMVNRCETDEGHAGADGGVTALDVPSKGSRTRRLVALRESLEGAWRLLEPWEEGTMRMGRGVYGGVEVVDLSGG